MGLSSYGACCFIIGMVMLPYMFFPGVLVCLFSGVMVVMGLLGKGTRSVANVLHESYPKRTCPNCKSKISFDTKYCGVCGQETSHVAEKVPINEDPIKESILSESKINRLEFKITETMKLLDNLQQKMDVGDISKETYFDLKNNFEDKKSKLKKEIQKVRDSDPY